MLNDDDHAAIPEPTAGPQVLDLVFAALSDPVRRAILERLKEGDLLVSELAAPFAITVQAVSRHIQVLVRAGLVRQERSGRVSRCSLEAGPILEAATWINGYSQYWQAQFDNLAAWLLAADRDRARQDQGALVRARAERPEGNIKSNHRATGAGRRRKPG